MNKSIVIVGGGALGSHLIQFIRNFPAQVTLIDFDSVEAHNLLGQFHGAQGKGRKKVLALQQMMLGLWGTKITIIPHKLTVDNAVTLLKDAGLVVDCVDNSETRILIQQTVRNLNIPCLHGALSADGSLGRVVFDEWFTADNMGALSGQATCEDGANLPFHALMGAHLALAVQRFLQTGAKESFQVTSLSLVRIA